LRSPDDLELHAAARMRTAGAHDRPQSARDATLPPDHLADVAFGDVQPKDERPVVALDLLDAHGVGLVDEPPRKFREQLVHG
jgi:hypothetical protein